MLVNMVSSSDVEIAGRIAGVRAFAKLGSSSVICSKAYEVCIHNNFTDMIISNMTFQVCITRYVDSFTDKF